MTAALSSQRRVLLPPSYRYPCDQALCPLSCVLPRLYLWPVYAQDWAEGLAAFAVRPSYMLLFLSSYSFQNSERMLPASATGRKRCFLPVAEAPYMDDGTTGSSQMSARGLSEALS